MNFFEIDFLERMTRLLKEAFKFKKYKAMPNVLAVFTGILMLPVVIASFFAIIPLAMLGFLFSFISYPVKYIHELLNKEGKEVKHLTQAIIYAFSWPIVFINYVFTSFILLIIIPMYTVFMFLTYIWTLGGFKFHLFANYTGDISITVNERYMILPLVYVFIGLILVFLAPMIHGVAIYKDLYYYFMEDMFTTVFFNQTYPSYIGIHVAFTTLYTLIGFTCAHNKASKQECVVEE